MKLSPIFRSLSIICYLFIFLQGMIIAIPLGCFLISGLFEAEPLTRIFIAFADVALLTLFIQTFQKKTKRALLIELIAYFFLLSPLVKILTSVPLYMFNYTLFFIPTSCFVLLYPLSLLFSFREYRQGLKVASD